MGWISCGKSHNVRDEGSGITQDSGLCCSEHWRQIMYKLFIAAPQRLETFCKHQGKTFNVDKLFISQIPTSRDFP